MSEDNKSGVSPWGLNGLNGLLETLSKLPPVPPPPPVVKNLWYNNQTVKIDGWTFESCRFDNCLLIVHSSSFTLKNCHFDKSNSIQWGLSVIPVIQLFNHQSDIKAGPPFTAVRNQDGTVTIGG